MTMLDAIYQVDLRMLLWCRKSRFYPQFITLVRAISKSGDGYLQLLLPSCYWLLSADGKAFFYLTLFAFSIERCCYLVLKHSLKRRRPPDIVPDFASIVTASDQFSFPSGHTMAAFLLADLTVTEFGLAALPIYVWASCVGCSRVILGVHFPTDILAGAALGTVFAQLITGV